MFVHFSFARFIVVFSFFFCLFAQAAELTCEVCGMTIQEHGRNHIILKSDTAENKIRHVCSSSCAHKIRKHDASYTRSEVVDFNHTESFIPGDKAFFLIQSSKIKADMGPNVMAPYAAAFASKAEAEAAKAKYGDGTIVQGADNAFK